MKIARAAIQNLLARRAFGVKNVKKVIDKIFTKVSNKGIKNKIIIIACRKKLILQFKAGS
jgi:hypothetical protein